MKTPPVPPVQVNCGVDIFCTDISHFTITTLLSFYYSGSHSKSRSVTIVINQNDF